MSNVDVEVLPEVDDAIRDVGFPIKDNFERFIGGSALDNKVSSLGKDFEETN